MHDPRRKRPNRILSGLGLLFCLYLSLAGPQAFADSNIMCGGGTGAVSKTVEFGNLPPNQQFQLGMSANCQTLKVFPSGVSLGQFQYNLQGKMDTLIVFHGASAKQVPLQIAGTVGPVCLPSACVRLNAGADVSYAVTIAGNSGSVFGNYSVLVALNYTMIGAVINSGDFQTLTINYSVGQPGCSIISDSSLYLPFGTLSSNDFATSQQIAYAVLDCPTATKVSATLTSGQSTTGAAGTSTTSLPELLMLATWADTNTPVEFNIARKIDFTAGVNAIPVGFRPQLAFPGATPSGSFVSQYTLNITYL